jgi:hypothetical protein
LTAIKRAGFIVTDRDVVIEAVARGLDVKSVRIGIERETAERGKLRPAAAPSGPHPRLFVHLIRRP